MYTVVIRETQEGKYLVSWHQDEMPAFDKKEYDTLEEALRNNSDYNWQEPGDDFDGNVIYFATYK